MVWLWHFQCVLHGMIHKLRYLTLTVLIPVTLIQTGCVFTTMAAGGKDGNIKEADPAAVYAGLAADVITAPIQLVAIWGLAIVQSIPGVDVMSRESDTESNLETETSIEQTEAKLNQVQ